MKHIIITKDNLLSFNSTSICILVPDIIDDDKINITNSFTSKSEILTKGSLLDISYTIYDNEQHTITIYLCTPQDTDDYVGFKYKNTKLIENRKFAK